MHLDIKPSSVFLSYPQLQRESFGLPSYDALAQILPDYQHLFRSSGPQKLTPGPSDDSQWKQKEQAQKHGTYEVHNPPKRAPIPDFPDDAQLSSELSDHQIKEVENYRVAMCKMAEDIIALRGQLGALEAENSRLRSDLSLHQEVGRTLLMDTDVDVMTKAEIEDRIASLKVKLASESSKAASQRDKIQQLQNELIRKNDSEKELESLRRVHQQQQAELQRHQSHGAKMAALETTVRQQEKVIEKMERVLDAKLRERNKENEELRKLNKKDKADSKRKEIESVLAAENARLREELQRMRSQPPPVVIQQPPQSVALLPDREKLSLLGQLEKAEARIRALESQLKASSREWGREKQALNTKLSEHQHGFQHSSTVLLHDVPMKSVTQSVIGRIRHRQLDPLK
ncbi:coiled-coil domain-containing protein 33 [Engraulis encrasicolus]|uniref:coiled-coil domain-containing protein 33 n=1 Tax=Engraulis encrasicolus TaxID=184585 RepID=UPI002FD60C21